MGRKLICDFYYSKPKIDIYYSLKDNKAYSLKPKRKETIKIRRGSRLSLTTDKETHYNYHLTEDGVFINVGFIPTDWLDDVWLKE